MSAKEDFINNLYISLKAMNDGDDSKFANGLSSCVKDFVESGKVETVDKGKVPAGNFVGYGSGSFSLSDTTCAGIILAACKTMATLSVGGNAILSTAIASGINTMCCTPLAIETSVSGAATSEGGTVTPIAKAKAKGSFSGDMSGIVSGLNITFDDLDSDEFKKSGNDGDMYLAENLADYIEFYITKGTVSTNGVDASISGSTGNGSVSF